MWCALLAALLCSLHEYVCCLEGQQLWHESARRELERRVGVTPPTERARNVVLVVGDGLGLPTLAATRLLRGQKEGNLGEDTWLAWDRFPALALAKTYNSDAQVGDSAACATALLCGVKANYGTLGMSGANFNQCDSSGEPVPSMLSWAQDEGLATGIVTNTRLSHATPAALYAHAHSRYWEDDSKVPVHWRAACKDIARQLVDDSPGSDINVILGGGWRHWRTDGRRLDGRDLEGDWLRDKRRRGLLAHLVHTAGELRRLDTQHVDYLLGIFAESHLSYEVDRGTEEPSLSHMTSVALNILQRSDRGFFLFIEGADSVRSDVDGLPYATLQFGNGPAHHGARRDSTPSAAAPRSWATHGGEDVPVFAQGPLATTLFTGVFDQSYVPHAVAYAACLAEHRQRCTAVKPSCEAGRQSALVRRSVSLPASAACCSSLAPGVVLYTALLLLL